MKKLLVLLGIVIGLVACAPYASAAVSERIRSFETDVVVRQNGEAQVRETIVYDFGNAEKHGIYRDIPIDYKDGATSYYVTASLQSATTAANQAVQTQTEEVNGNLRIRLGDEDVKVTGQQTYVLSYTLAPIVMQKDGRPFLNLDVLGEGWQVPVDSFSAQVTLENGAAMTGVEWFGAVGTAGRATAQNIQPYQAVTINAYLPAGYTQHYLLPEQQRPFDIVAFLAELWWLIAGLALAAMALGIAVYRWLHARKKRKAQTVIPEYEPPKDMSPAEIGLIDDDTSDMREITATVIDWAVRGYITITRHEKKGIFGSVDYTLTRKKKEAESTLQADERQLFAAFFGGSDAIKLSKLDKTKMYQAVSKFREAIKKRLSDQGFYDSKGHIIIRGTLTDAGAKRWAQVEGFKDYITVVEKDRLAFSDAPEKSPKRFNELLPYAIALGVEKQWAKQFEGVDMGAETNWYVGNMAAFSAVSMTSDISDSFAATVNSNASVSPSGGSAGGGVGGGGGGSW